MTGTRLSGRGGGSFKVSPKHSGNGPTSPGSPGVCCPCTQGSSSGIQSTVHGARDLGVTYFLPWLPRPCREEGTPQTEEPDT